MKLVGWKHQLGVKFCTEVWNLLNNGVNEEKCLIGCFIQTRTGTENGNKFDEIERGCVENGPEPDQQGDYSRCDKNHIKVSWQIKHK